MAGSYSRTSRSTLWRQARSDVVSAVASLESLQSEGLQLDEGGGLLSSDVDECSMDSLDVPSLLPCDIDSYDVDSCNGWRWSNSDSESEMDEYLATDEVTDSLEYNLGEWSIANNITHTALRSLLDMLRPYHPSLPKDPRTLLRTPTKHNIRNINGGQYCHIGLELGLANLVLKSNSLSLCDQLELQINVDGIPLFKSSSMSLWPILCSVKNIGNKDPFVVGAFCGKEKPGSASEFLADFVSEADSILRNGLTIGEKNFSAIIHSFVCDAPARAFLKGIKCHSGYASCEKCTIHGEYEGKVVFPFNVDVPLRTDESFNAQLDEDHHVESVCPLAPLPIGCVSQFGLDYMHLGCLGLMRRLLLYWKGPVGPLHVRIGRKSCSELSIRLLYFASFCPVEFARKPRSIDDIMRWKATEFRQFLMYSGPFVLCGLLPETLFNNFMLVFVAFRILASNEFAVVFNDYANELLRKFVQDAEILYGRDIMVYNVHSVIHLAAYVKQLGCLDDFGAFVFENKLGQLKKVIRNPRQPLQQLVRRLQEMQSFDAKARSSEFEHRVKMEHWSGPLPSVCSNCRQYRRLETAQWTLSVKAGDNCMLLKDGTPAVVKNIVKMNDETLIICSEFENVSDAFLHPLPSSKLSICSVTGESSRLFIISVDDVRCKCVCWPAISKADSYILVPLMHKE